MSPLKYVGSCSNLLLIGRGKDVKARREPQKSVQNFKCDWT